MLHVSATAAAELCSTSFGNSTSAQTSSFSWDRQCSRGLLLLTSFEGILAPAWEQTSVSNSSSTNHTITARDHTPKVTAHARKHLVQDQQ